jgi:esterase/lipase
MQKKHTALIKRILTIGIALLGFGIIAFISGPFFQLNPNPPTKIEYPSTAHDLDAYLIHEESLIPHIKAGTEKKIVWIDSQNPVKTPVAIIYFHGFTASRGDTSPLIENLAKDLKANVYFTRLKAHGLDGEAFSDVSAQDWLDDAEEAYAIGQKIGDKVIAIGMSTGALLPLYLLHTGHELEAQILLSPNFSPQNTFAKYASGPLGKFWAQVFVGPYRQYHTENADHRYYWTSRYRSEGLVALMNLVNYVNTFDFAQIKIPSLVLYTHKDSVVDVSLIEKRFAAFGATQKNLLDLKGATRHELVGSALAPEMNEPVQKTIEEFLNALP